MGNVVVEYTYDAWGNHIIDTLDSAYDELSQLNPFRYRGYYYDTETGLYFLKTRYYDPEVGRFITIDDLSYLDPDTINGLNLYAYCGNNPVMNVDPSGHSLLAIFLLLAATTIVGAAVGGKVAYDRGARGWEFFGGMMLGAAIGLAVGGAIVSLTAVCFGAFGAATVFGGVAVSQAFAIGALAFDFFAFVVAPILGVTMDGIEYESYPEIPELPTIPTYSVQKPKTEIKMGLSYLLQNYKREYKLNNDRISWRNIRKLSALCN